MYSLFGKLGVRLALSPSTDQRWRLLQAGIGVFAFTLLVCAAVSFTSVSERNWDRDYERMMIGHLTHDEEGIAKVGTSLPFMNDRQFQVVWLESTPDFEIPEFGGPGPAPGEAFVSPGLLAASGNDSGLAAEFGLTVSDRNDTVDWDAILAFHDEYLAIATVRGTPQEAHHLGTLTGFGPTANTKFFTPEEALAGRGPQPGDEIAANNTLDERFPSASSARTYGTWLLVIPGLVLLRAAFGAKSEIRRDRKDALADMGASRSHLFVLDAIEATVIAVPASALALAAWVPLSSRLGHIPASSYEFIRGDAAIGVGAALLIAMAVWGCSIAMAGVTSVAQELSATRRTLKAATRSLLAATIPLVFALAATLMEGSAPPILFWLSVGACILLMSYIGRGLLRFVGLGTLERRRAAGISPQRLVAGRRLSNGDRIAARSFAVIAILMLTTVVASGFLVRGYEAEVNPFRAANIETANLQSATPADVSRISAELREIPHAFLIDPAVEGQVSDATMQARVVRSPDCPVLAVIFESSSGCEGTDLPSDAIANAERLGFTLEVDEVSRDTLTDASLIARVTSHDDHASLQSTITRIAGPSSVHGFLASGPRAITAWLPALLTLSVLTLTASYALLVVNTAREPQDGDSSLASLSPPTDVTAAIKRLTLTLPGLLGGVLGVGYGMVLCNVGQGLNLTRLPWGQAAVALGAITTVTAIAVETGARFQRSP